jgi:hypothetical protein
MTPDRARNVKRETAAPPLKTRDEPYSVAWPTFPEADMSDKTYRGSCFCGAVEVTVTGAPAGMGYCHCTSCREWSAGPVNAFTLWKPEAVKITKGEANLSTFNKTPTSSRKWCKTCGGHVLTDHPPLGLVDVYAATLRDFKFEPGVHVNYSETVLRMKDGLPKLKDFPKEFGGSGESCPE